MNIDALKYFRKAAQMGNLSRAALELHISQPTLTVSIQKLEESLGVALFIRSKKGIQLTPEGSTIYAQVDQLIQQWEDIAKSLNENKNILKGSVRVGCHPAVAQYTLPLILPQILHKHPELQVILRHDLSRKILQSIQDSEVDFGLVINPEKINDLTMTEIAKDEVTLWKNKNLKNNDVIIYDPSLFQSQWVLDKLKKKKIVFKQKIESSSLEVITSFLKAGVGHALLPKRVITDFDKSQTVKSFDDLPVYHDSLFMVYRSSYRQTSLGRHLIEEFKQLHTILTKS